MSDRLEGRRIVVLGYGHQGAAQARNLRAAGASVSVGARPGGTGAARARTAGFEVSDLEEAARSADVLAVMLPDEVVPELWPRLSAALQGAPAVVFAHGFNLLYAGLDFGRAGDVVVVAPTAPGRVLRASAERGERLPAYLAVHRDATGSAAAFAREYATRIGCGPLWPTTVREETEVDLFGEQAVLCGGLSALVAAAFETLVAKGYSPEISYLECVHQLKYLADLLHERGPAGFRAGISGTALFGDVTRGPRVIGEASRREMEKMLDEIRSGAFAREWMDEVARGKPRLTEAAERGAAHPIEAARRAALGGGPGGEGHRPESRKALSKD